MINKTINNVRRQNLELINKKIGEFSIKDFKKMKFLYCDVLITDFLKKWQSGFPEEIKNPIVWNKNVINNFYKLYDNSKSLPYCLKSYNNWLIFFLSEPTFSILDLIKLNKLLKGEKLNTKMVHRKSIESCLFFIFECKTNDVNSLPISIKKILKSRTSDIGETIEKLREIEFLVSMINSLANTITNIPELTFLTAYDIKNNKIKFILDKEIKSNSSFIFIKQFNFSYNKINNTFLGFKLNLKELIQLIAESEINNLNDVLIESIYKISKNEFDNWLESINYYLLMDENESKNALEAGELPVDLASDSQLNFFIKESLIFNFLNFYNNSSSLTAKETLKEKLRKIIDELD
jgi:hypothetical protein